MLPLYPLQPYRLPWTCEFRLSLLRKPHIIQSMSLSSAFHLPARRENLQPILADRLQHQEAWLLAFLLGLLQQALVEKRSNALPYLPCFTTIFTCSADCLYRLQSTTTNEDGEPPEESLLRGIEQVIAPCNRVAQRLLPCRDVTRGACQHRQPLIQSREQCLWWKQFHTGCCQFYRQWQTIQAHTDFSDGGGRGIGYLEVGLHGLGALEEERHRCI